MAMYHFPQYYPAIYGKYKVKSFTVNHIPCDTTTGRDSVLTKIFIDKTDLVMEYNNYQRRLIGNYQYDPANKQLKVIWHYPPTEHDTLVVKVDNGKNPGDKILSGLMGKNVIKIEMDKVKGE